MQIKSESTMMNAKSENKEQYFATLQGQELLSELSGRITNYYEYIKTYKLFAVWNKSYNTYFGRDRDGFNTTEIGRSGTQGELSVLKINHFRNLLQHLLVMTTSEKPNLTCRTQDTDYTSQAQTILGRGVLDYYLVDKKIEEKVKTAVEYSLLFGESFVVNSWDKDAGDPFSVDPMGRVIYTGDFNSEILPPHDMIRDINRQDNFSTEWYIVRKFENKWSLAAQHPELASKILSSKIELIDDINIRFHYSKSAYAVSDDCVTFTFIHKKCPALPQGRVVKFIGDEIILIDDILRYRDVPVRRIAAADYIGSPFGYSIAFDLLAVQDAIDALYSTVTTNELTFGVQSITALEGSNVSAKKLATGLNLITYSKVGGKPEPLNLTQTPPEIFTFLGMLEKVQETLSAISSVNRGNPEASLKSGAALAVVASQAVQFNNGLQKSYSDVMEKIGTDIITFIQDFGEIPRLIHITGESNKGYALSLKNKDIGKIKKVIVELGNPMMRTIAGRQSVADTLLAQGMINASQYLNIINTGRVEVATESSTKESLLIKAENEKISKIEYVQALADDNHYQHILEHRCVVADPEARVIPELLQAYVDHQNQHLNWLGVADPRLMFIFGQQQFPVPQQNKQDLAAQQGKQNPEAPKGQNPEEAAKTAMGGGAVDLQTVAPTNPQTGGQYDMSQGI